MYYLQSRYYDANVGRFICSDNPICIYAIAQTQFLSLFSYCDNTPIKFNDSLGFGPWTSTLSLRDYKKIHDKVADCVADSVSPLANREKYVKGRLNGKTCRGFLDVYDPITNTYYEVKSYLAAYTKATELQMLKYDNSKPVFPPRGNVKRGILYVSGSFNYGAWNIEYHSSKTVLGLVEYIPTYNKTRAESAKSVAVTIAVIFIILLAVSAAVGAFGLGAGALAGAI